METLLYFFKLIWRVKWWLIVLPLIVGGILVFSAKGKNGGYTVYSTVFTGIEGGYSLEEGANKKIQQNNMIDLFDAKSTLRRVSYHLFARVMVFGDPKNDNNICNASSYREIYNRMKFHKDLLKIVTKYRDEKDENGLFEEVTKYEKPNKDNFVYGLFNYYHPQYSFEALQKIIVNHLEKSDIVEISYTNSDPGIAYNTLDILIDEFNHEYQDVRYGETNKVITFYKDLLDSSGKELRDAEDEMTAYREDNRIINYVEESKALAGLDATYKNKYLEANIDYGTSKGLVLEIEEKLGDYIIRYKKNKRFITLFEESNKLSAKISSLEAFDVSEMLATDSLEKIKAKKESKSLAIESYKERLAKVDEEMHDAITQINSKYTTKEGFSKATLIDAWLNNLLKLRGAEASKSAIEKSMISVDSLYRHFAPIGSGLDRRDRDISIKADTYKKAIDGYNEAMNRKKGLEMTAATIKVLSPPSFPLNSINIDRKKLGIMASFMTFFALLGIFVIIELVDHTLRDKMRTERLTKENVLFAFPDFANKKNRAYNNECQEIAIKHLSTQILQFLNKRSSNGSYIIGISSLEKQEGKTYISELLIDYWKQVGLKAKHVNWNVDYQIQSQEYLLANSISDLTTIDMDIILVEFPAAGDYPIPSALLQECNVNIVVARSTRAWKHKDANLLSQLKVSGNGVPVQLILNEVDKSETELFTGMLPPYTRYSKFKYKLSNLGLTESGVNSYDPIQNEETNQTTNA